MQRLLSLPNHIDSEIIKTVRGPILDNNRGTTQGLNGGSWQGPGGPVPAIVTSLALSHSPFWQSGILASSEFVLEDYGLTNTLHSLEADEAFHDVSSLP